MLVFIIGLPGTGKTYFAKILADKIKAVHISSDSVRKEMDKMGKYDSGSRMLVYDEMKRRMLIALQEKKNVIIDATFYKRDLRNKFINAAKEITCSIHTILMTASDESVCKRVLNKRADSEADFNVYLKLKAAFEPINEPHLVFPSDQLKLNEMIDKVLKYFKERDD